MRLQHVIIACLILSLTGCINIAASLERQDMTVAETREASDCIPTMFGLSYGSATLEGALSEAVRPMADSLKGPKLPITKIRRVQLHDYQFLFFGARCVEVIGE